MVLLLLLVAVNTLMLCYLVLYSTMFENKHYYYKFSTIDHIYFCRTNQTLKTRLSKLVADYQTDWDEYLEEVAFSLRTQRQASTKYTPFLSYVQQTPTSACGGTYNITFFHCINYNHHRISYVTCLFYRIFLCVMIAMQYTCINRFLYN